MRMAILWPNDHILYSYYNSYIPLKERVVEDYSNPEVVLILDIIDSIRPGSPHLEEFRRLKSQGTKFIAFAMDPGHFSTMESFHKDIGIDHYFVTDARFVERFSYTSCSHIEFNVDPLSIPEKLPQKEKYACYYGHLNWARVLPPYVDRLEIKSRQELMREVSKYKFGFVFDSGADETGNGMCNYNKGKYVEYLSAGVIPVVQPAIVSHRYGKYFVKMSEFNEEKEYMGVDMREIRSLNNDTLTEILAKCEQVLRA